MTHAVLVLALSLSGQSQQAWPAAQGPGKVLPQAQAPSKIAPAPQAPAKYMPAPAPQAPAKYIPAAAPQAPDALVHIRQGREDQDRRVVAGPAQRLNDGQPIDLTGQHTIHDDNIVGFTRGQKHTLATIVSMVNRMAGLHQTLADKAAHPLIVFHQE